MTATASDPALILEDLAKTFHPGGRTIEALAGLTLSVAGGQVTGLIGPDGAGKTTLMRLAAGLLKPDRGRLLVLGMDVTERPGGPVLHRLHAPALRALRGPERPGESGSVCGSSGGPGARAPGRFAELLQMVGLAPFTDRLAGKLSGGMKQKLGLACTLVRPPRLLLLDEPTVGVDPVSRRELWAIVYRLVREEGMGVLLSTAYLDEAERCDEVILIHQGRLLGQGPPASFSDPLAGHAFLVNVPGVPKRRLQTRLARASGGGGRHHPGRAGAGRDPGGGTSGSVGPGRRHSGRSRVRWRPASRMPSSAGCAPRPPRGPTSPRSCPWWPSRSAGGVAAIRVDGVQRRFGDFVAVKGVSFEVSRGEVFGLLGANGAGKTTTFRMLCGLLPASQGHLEVAGTTCAVPLPRRAGASATWPSASRSM